MVQKSGDVKGTKKLQVLILEKFVENKLYGTIQGNEYNDCALEKEAMITDCHKSQWKTGEK